MNETTVKKARVRAIIIGTSLSLMLISFVYAYVQQGIARQQTEIAIRNIENLVSCKEQQVKANQKLEAQNRQLERVIEDLRSAMIEAQKERDNSKSK
jgi:cell division protein FtsB